MISGLCIYNLKGEVVISRFYRDDVSKTTVDLFGSRVFGSKDTGSSPPIRVVDHASFMFIRHENLYFVAVTRSNTNPALAIEFLLQWVRILKSYLGNEFDEESVRTSITLIYELLDETMDFGFPQICAIDLLQLYINLGNVRRSEAEEKDPGQLTSQLTGIVDWRREGHRYRVNQVHVDIIESINLLMGTNGNVLRNEVSGEVVLRTQLTGMPECKFAVNDKLSMEGRKPEGEGPQRAVDIDDCTFHRCVRLGKFDSERTITFVPPDGEFELMRYRVTNNISLPFKVIPAIKEEGKTHVTIDVKVTGQFDSKMFGENVAIKIPVPPNTARTNIVAPVGRARYEPEQRAIVWRIKRFLGGAELMLHASVDLMQTTRTKAWSRPPISVDFNVQGFTASGTDVLYLKVYEKSGYKAPTYSRRRTRSGHYQIRI